MRRFCIFAICLIFGVCASFRLATQYLFIPAKYKDCYTAYVLNELAGCTAMIFTRTCESARRLALLLRALGFDAVPIHGSMSQPKRLGCARAALPCSARLL
jgi:superfamily II DNA/RNA helicase